MEQRSRAIKSEPPEMSSVDEILLASFEEPVLKNEAVDESNNTTRCEYNNDTVITQPSNATIGTGYDQPLMVVNGPSISTPKRVRKKTQALSQNEVYSYSLDDDSDFNSDISSSENEESSDNGQTSDSEASDVDSKPKAKKLCTQTAKFTWSDGPFEPAVHLFDPSQSGVRSHLRKKTELDYFFDMISKDIVSVIVRETNRYAAHCLQSEEWISKHNLLEKWTDTTSDEMYLFFAVTMLMVQNKRLSLKEYWSGHWLLRSEAFSTLMPRDRYFALLHMIHFCRNDDASEWDKLFQMGSILDQFRNNFKKGLVPFENLWVDESMLLFKGQRLFKKYIRTKNHRFGLKLFVLCDVKTGFVLDLITYTGKRSCISRNENLGVPGSIVMKLLRPYLGNGHTVFTDSWYTSPLLARELHDHQTNFCGAASTRRPGMPDYSVLEDLPVGELEAKCTDIMMVLRWKNKHEVRMLTTIHRDDLKTTLKKDSKMEEHVQKPACLVDFNDNRARVDKSDVMISSLECIRNNVKWYKKLFFHLMDISLLNAHALYELETGTSVPVAKFQLQVTSQLVKKYHTHGEPLIGKKKFLDVPSRLVERHFPCVVPGTAKQTNPCRRCHVCANTTQRPQKRRESRYMCKDCDVGLCILPCFTLFHTVKIY